MVGYRTKSNVLDAAEIRTLGKLLGLERVIVREDWARLSFREGGSAQDSES